MEHVKDRNELLKRLELKDKVCAEVGVFTGQFALKILEEFPKELYLIDPWASQPLEAYGDIINHNQEDFDGIYAIVKKNFADFSNVHLMRQQSHEAARDFPNASLDFIHIDGNHSFGHCMFDLSAWSTKVRTGGVIMVHDYAREHYYGVAQAVQYFCKVTGYLIEVETQDSPSSVLIRVK